jgi:flagellin-specific chaperone FliS
MNITLARQHYTMTKENSVSNADQNAFAIKLAMEQLIKAMNGLMSSVSIEDKEQDFEIALTRIYLLQKCLDFKAGGELAKNLFRVYEHVRQEIIKACTTGASDAKDLENAIAYITLIYEGWSEITEKA